ncbi:MAG TPA: hypothetical protein PK772_03260 [Chitinophagaceae bacterium]|nr:hypothetical protein [Chitinophagaceae bacterium]
MGILQNELDWIYYGGKHYESIYTRFYQSYILPQKFNIDKRKGHLSDLIHANQITREQALQEMEKPAASPEIIEQDKNFAIKKLGLSETDFDVIMKEPLKTFKDYPNNSKLVFRIKKIVNWMRGKNLYSK